MDLYAKHHSNYFHPVISHLHHYPNFVDCFSLRIYFSNKIKTGNIILLDDGKIISENTKIAEVFNDYFINIVKDLQIPDIILAEVPVIPQNINDPIDNILYTYHNHPSIIKIC